MRNATKLPLLLTILLCLPCICSCNKAEAISEETAAPFAEAFWSSSLNDIITIEGESSYTYDSVYGGTTYSYPKEYNGKNGTVKYMFDDKDALMCIAWAYGSDDETELYNLYDEINQYVNDIYGESNYQADSNTTNYGNVWHLDRGDIILSTMITSDNKALQYAYLNPVVSHNEPAKNNVSDGITILPILPLHQEHLLSLH